MKIHISEGNRKMGRIPSVSLPPIITCQDNPPCAKKCYARKMYEGYCSSTVGKSWTENFYLYKSDPEEYFRQIAAWIRKNPPAYFRWHIGGDIPDYGYYDGMVGLAKAFSGTKFLAFTRRRKELGIKYVEPNLFVRQSLWFDEVQPQSELCFAKVIAPEQDIPDHITMCPGRCENCHMCWSNTRTIGFMLH